MYCTAVYTKGLSSRLVLLRLSGSSPLLLPLLLWEMCVLYGCLDHGLVIQACITEAQR